MLFNSKSPFLLSIKSPASGMTVGRRLNAYITENKEIFLGRIETVGFITKEDLKGALLSMGKEMTDAEVGQLEKPTWTEMEK